MTKSFRQRISDGEMVILAEGYVFEFERRGYLQAGAFCPEVVLEHPHLVKQLSEEFVHSGSDIVEAFTYYGHREKLRIIGREGDLEPMNRKALQIAKEVADATGTLMAGNICNTTVFDIHNEKSHEETRRIFKEQIEWCNEEGADLIVAETYPDYAEAKLALECIRKFSSLPAVINIAPHANYTTRDGYNFADACKLLEEQGADVVGLNCSSGPETLTSMMRLVREKCTGPLAALPVTYRTTPDKPQMQNLTMPDGSRAFPYNLDAFMSAPDDFYQFGLACKELNIQVPGICCGCTSRHLRRLSMALGRKPPSCKYFPDMTKHYIFGSDPMLHDVNTKMLRGKIDDAGTDKEPVPQLAGV